ncbi:class I SAM-dependent methyltransferase [Ruegeria sp. ANG10]|uniref:class I SAM-dependent methyltransferase n=1 Tax=Ruegeria sp. ANG10 TaxID=3042467 RepID=UPI0034521EB7
MNDRYSGKAEQYEQVGLNGTDLLAYRDLASLINTYSNRGTAVDFGCGSGKSTRLLKRLGLSVVGLDISAEQLKLARSADPSGDYRQIGPNDELPVQDVDIVLSVFVFMELGSKQALESTAKAIERALAKDGVFFMVVTTKDFYSGDWLTLDTNFAENAAVESGDKVRVRFPDADLTLTDYFWTDEDYSSALGQAGFGRIDRYYPLGKDSDGLAWKDETSKAPFVIYVARKGD